MSTPRRYTPAEVKDAMDYKVVFMGCAVDDFDKLQTIAALQEEVYILRQQLAASKGEPQANFFIGQRVLLNDSEIGTVVAAPKGASTRFGIWVRSSSKGYASDYALHNVKPLPGGQV